MHYRSGTVCLVGNLRQRGSAASARSGPASSRKFTAAAAWPTSGQLSGRATRHSEIGRRARTADRSSHFGRRFGWVEIEAVDRSRSPHPPQHGESNQSSARRRFRLRRLLRDAIAEIFDIASGRECGLTIFESGTAAEPCAPHVAQRLASSSLLTTTIRVEIRQPFIRNCAGSLLHLSSGAEQHRTDQRRAETAGPLSLFRRPCLLSPSFFPRPCG